MFNGCVLQYFEKYNCCLPISVPLKAKNIISYYQERLGTLSIAARSNSMYAVVVEKWIMYYLFQSQFLGVKKGVEEKNS